MTKLKCWKKRTKNQWWNSDKLEILYITEYPLFGKFGKRYMVIKASQSKRFVLETNKTKPRAIKFAKKYMKEHDKC